jgi:hypothetical protein
MVKFRDMRRAIGLVEVVSVGNSLFLCIDDALLSCKTILTWVVCTGLNEVTSGGPPCPPSQPRRATL